jgi:putative Mg2+ transporter-C (MgtC) family protein
VETTLQLTLFGRIALGAFLGFAIGLEREYRGKIAGDRTFALLAMGSAAFVGAGIALFPLTADRVIQGVAAGVGFLGVGIIFRGNRDGEPRGLTTAAASWSAASIGVLAGAGVYLTAVLATLLVIAVLESQYLPYVGRLVNPRAPGPPPGTDT